jgi:hypothetical protein
VSIAGDGSGGGADGGPGGDAAGGIGDGGEGGDAGNGGDGGNSWSGDGTGGHGGNANDIAAAEEDGADGTLYTLGLCADDVDFDCSEGEVQGDGTGYVEGDVDGDCTGWCFGDVTGDVTGTLFGADNGDDDDDDNGGVNNAGGGGTSDAAEVASVRALPSTGAGESGFDGGFGWVLIFGTLMLGVGAGLRLRGSSNR